MLMRLQRFLADCGAASRRAGETLIRTGRVAVNGRIVRELGVKVDPAADEVCLDGSPVKLQRKHHIALHKPAGYLCTRLDPQARHVVTDLLPREWRHLYPVGRLDYNTEGLLFLTNDGEFCLRLTHPRFGVAKTYQATVAGRVAHAVLAQMTHGVVHQGERLQAARARLLSANASHSVVELELAEGRKREVRRLFESQGLVVERLVRTRIGPIRLGQLLPGRWRVLTPAELEALRCAAENAPSSSQAHATRAVGSGASLVPRRGPSGPTGPTTRR
jgi:pseudouridine synthase